MTEPVEGRSIDENLQLMVEDLRALRRELQRAPEEATQARLSQLTAGYVRVNEPLLELAFETWRQTPEDELRQICSQVRALDESAARHDFESEGWFLVSLAPRILRTASLELIRVDEDHVRMLLRVVEYAQYLADSSGQTVQWHPVPSAGDVDRIEQLLASVPSA
jgi:hypothetical protein